ncbi:MAG: NifU family protein [Gemmatimonadota bacterium]|nr:NifU family protein [Gemmatimonadota bacterium]
MADEEDLRTVGERIEALVGEIGALPDPVARRKAEDLLQLVVRFYGAGLERMLEIVDQQPDDVAERLFGRFSDDTLVASLLLLHGLHPQDPESRIRHALEKVRAHGVDVSLIELQAGVARVRVSRSADGRGPAGAVVRQAIEQAVQVAAPEVASIEIEGLEPDALPLVQLSVGSSTRTLRAQESLLTS